MRFAGALVAVTTFIIFQPNPFAPINPALAFQIQDTATDDTQLGPVFLISLGGKLYDDLWRVLDREPPVEANPAFPAKGLYSSRDSWRCVSCHGWDYEGVTISDTQFPSLKPLSGTDPIEIVERIRDHEHPFPADQVDQLAIELLALFISQGQFERTDFLDQSGQALGDPEAGRDVFEGACINCHQLDGRRFLDGERGDRSSLGWVVRNRPDQALHKILNGVPAAEMLSLRFLSGSQIADLIAYLQVLDPAEK